MGMSQYRDLFVSEARGHLSLFNELIVRIEDTGADEATVNELFRHAHSLKGMAATMGYDTITALAHTVEDQMSRVRSGEMSLVPALADLLFEAADSLAEMISQVESGSESITEAIDLIERLTHFTPEADSEVAVTLTEIDSSGQQSAAPPVFRQADTFKSIRIKTETLDRLVNITGELITNRYLLADCAKRYGLADFDAPIQQLSGLLRELRDEVFKARMLPFDFIAERFPRLVRDLARRQGKETTLHLEGRDIELDRGILEGVAEPLVHLLRNAIDHGLETPEERAVAGKPSSGDIRLTVTRDKDHVDIVVEDDGRGMDPGRLKAKAVDKGFVSLAQADAMTLQELLMLTCMPGFSTSETVSDVSGRGVGMDAVRSAVISLGGTLVIQSKTGLGSRFTMRLPITVSIINALLVKLGSFDIAFPINSVRRTFELKSSEIIEKGKQQVTLVEGSYLPVKCLGHAEGRPFETSSDQTLLQAILCEAGESQVVFLVDRVIGQQEIFVRPLGLPLSRLRGINGATVTGDGRVIFIADTAALA